MGVVGAILIRDEYLGGAQHFMFTTLSFSFGAIVATMSLVRMGEIERARSCAHPFVSGWHCCPAAHRQNGALFVYCALTFIWGIGAGVLQAVGRSIIQLSAPQTHIGRALSVYELGYLGSLGLGALVMGFVVGAVGPRQATLPLAVVMTLLLAYLFLRTRLWWQVRGAASAS